VSLDAFITLSEFLIGVPFPPPQPGQQPLPPITALDPALGQVYMTQLTAWSPQSSFMGQLLTTWAGIQAMPPGQGQIDAVNSQIMSDPNLGPLARQIILAWYTGFLPWSPGPPPQQPTPDPANYEQTLVWSLAQAHPMGVPLSFGYWQYPPVGSGS
jgi:hypothetical protein